MQNMKNIILCHGILQSANKDTLDKLKPFLRDFNVQEADYGKLASFGARFFNDNLATMLAGMANYRSVGIGHSNGCPILVHAAAITNRIETLVLINAALDNDTEFPASVKRVFVLHTEFDDTVRVSSFLPWHVWGDMGRVGYKGEDERVVNVDIWKLLGAQEHSDVINNTPEELVSMLVGLGALDVR